MPLFDPASAQALSERGAWEIVLLAGAVVGLVTAALILFPVVIWRERSGRKPAHFDKNTPLEISYTIIPLLLVIALFVLTFRTEIVMDHIDAHPAQVVDTTGFRWSWQFVYPGAGITERGTPLQPPTLYLPVDETTQIDLRSVDVTHSFWVPAFLFKRDAIPGLLNTFDITPTRVGSYPGKCAQFCGLDHTLMTFSVHVVSDRAFARFVASHGRALP